MILAKLLCGLTMILAVPFYRASEHVEPLLSMGERKAVEVAIFLSPECPISKAQTPELKKLQADFPELVFRLYFPVQTTREAEARAFCERYGLKGPIVMAPQAFDRARALGATTLPECFVLDSEGSVLYSGLIESSHSQPGKKRSSGHRQELRAALGTLRLGQIPEKPRTQAVGCKITFPESISSKTP